MQNARLVLSTCLSQNVLLFQGLLHNSFLKNIIPVVCVSVCVCLCVCVCVYVHQDLKYTWAVFAQALFGQVCVAAEGFYEGCKSQSFTKSNKSAYATETLKVGEMAVAWHGRSGEDGHRAGAKGLYQLLFKSKRCCSHPQRVGFKLLSSWSGDCVHVLNRNARII